MSEETKIVNLNEALGAIIESLTVGMQLYAKSQAEELKKDMEQLANVINMDKERV